MPFSIKDWKDAPNTTTPISAAALEDLETRLSGYTDDAIADFGAGQYPWTIDIDPFLPPATQTTWSTKTVNSGQLHNGWLESSTSTGSEIGWDVIMAAGEWTIAILGATGTNQGIITVSLDGASQGTIDQYAGAGAFNVLGQLTGLTVATTGKKRLLLSISSKNGASSNYKGIVSAVRLLRTA